jgi:hypothetical protein
LFQIRLGLARSLVQVWLCCEGREASTVTLKVKRPIVPAADRIQQQPSEGACRGNFETHSAVLNKQGARFKNRVKKAQDLKIVFSVWFGSQDLIFSLASFLWFST